MITDALIRTAARIRAAARTVVGPLAVGLAVSLALATSAAARAAETAAAPAAFAEGQKVQVREGDTWSAATILKREGRKFLVHYDGADASSDEWVTTDRLRPPGAADSAKAAGGAQPPAAAKPAAPAVAPAAPTFEIGQKAEVKWGGLWSKATVTNKRGAWYLVTYDQGNRREWVEPWRLRRPGSVDDPIGYAKPNPTVRKDEGPPRPEPGPAPEPAGGRAGGAGAGAAAGAGKSDNVAVSETNRSAVQEVVLGGGGGNFAAVPADGEARPAKPPVTHPVVLSASSGEFFDHVAHLGFASPATGVAAAVHVNAPPGKPQQVRVERVDLAAGRSLNAVAIPANIEPLDFSPDGKLLLACSAGFGFGAKGRLDLWQVDGASGASESAGGPGTGETKEAKHVVSFIPFADRQPTARDIAWARFMDAEHVLVMNGQGHLGLWQFRGAKAVWAAAADPQTTPALSANGRYLAAVVGGDVVLADAATGKTLGRLKAEGLAGTMGLRLSFKPDGRQLAAAGQDLLLVWDLGTGKLAHDLSPVGAAGNAIDWVAEGYVLLDRQHLLSLDKKMVVWTYQNPTAGRPGAAGTYAGRFWYVADAEPGRGGSGGKPAVVPVTLPHDAASRAAAAADIEQQLLVRPGARVSLEVAVPGESQEKVVEALKARLKANGVTVTDGQPVKLVARTEPGQTREVSYRRIGAGPFGESKVSVTETKSRLALETADGQVLWQRMSVTSPPPMLVMKEGQTTEQAVAAAMKPSYTFFEKTRLPPYVPKSRTGLGTSRLTPTGVQGG